MYYVYITFYFYKNYLHASTIIVNYTIYLVMQIPLYSLTSLHHRRHCPLVQPAPTTMDLSILDELGHHVDILLTTDLLASPLYLSYIILPNIFRVNFMLQHMMAKFTVYLYMYIQIYIIFTLFFYVDFYNFCNNFFFHFILFFTKNKLFITKYN